ncbi:MAG: PD-(D/E)XK nuclease family protein [Rhodothermaceae bacterium]|nr:PD-(D/E)XK nuclease family protein [Rhodothermaceae bacterium]
MVPEFDPIHIPRATLVEGHRYRTPEGITYPSVTTILSATKPTEATDGIQAWRERVGAEVADYIVREAARTGTNTHALNEAYVVGEVHNNTAGLLARAHHENFIPYLDRMGRVYGTEVPLYSDTMKVAGTADCIAEYNDLTSIIDYKTKRSPQQPEWMIDYYVQTAAYSMMFTALTGIAIQQCVILVSSEKDTIQEFLCDPRDYVSDFLLRLEQYYLGEL